MWGIHFACWVNKATDTNPEYVILFAFHDKWLRECASMLLLYVHCLSCFHIKYLCTLSTSWNGNLAELGSHSRRFRGFWVWSLLTVLQIFLLEIHPLLYWR
jgi:hypothetical protein